MRCDYITWEGVPVSCRNKLEIELLLQKRNAQDCIKAALVKIGAGKETYAERINLTIGNELFLSRDL